MPVSSRKPGSVVAAEIRGRGIFGPPMISLAVATAALTLQLSTAAFGQVPTVLSGGPPVLVTPYVPEPGVPLITITPGVANPFAGADGSGGSGSGSGGETGGNIESSNALTTLLGTPFGFQAVANAQALGVNPSAIAAMCVMESQCTNVANGSGSSASGPWQMINSTYNAMIAAAAQDDPSLAASFAGKTDPATEAAAASELVKEEANQLIAQGVSDPTVLDVRAGYAFGDSKMLAVQQAPDSQTLGSILTSWSPSTWASNGLTPSTTVGQWRQTIINKIGSAANQSILFWRLT